MANSQDWEERPPQYPQQDYGQQPWQDQPWQPQRYDFGAHQRRLQSGPQEQQRQPGYPQPGYGSQYPPPGQPWQQPGYGQQSPYPPQPQDMQQMPGPQPSPRRKRHTARNILVVLGALVAVVIAVIAANSPDHTVSTTGTSSSNTGADTAGSGGGAKTQTATTGTAITLSGNNSGEQMSVTVTKVISNAQPGDEFSGPPTGDRLYAVQFRLRDTGSAAYSDAPSNGAAVVDSAGQSYQSELDTAAGCQSFPGSENIAPGAWGLGCIVFEVPESAKIVAVQFTLDSGMGPQTGQWNVG
jgi:Domain of unknown function (DUF4352)